MLAQTFDDDPFLLPALRGRDRDALLGALRAARTGGGEATAAPSWATTGRDGGVRIAEVVASQLYDARGDLAAIAVLPAAPTDPAVSLRRLGPPPLGGEQTADAVAHIVARAADRAWSVVSQVSDRDDTVDRGDDAGGRPIDMVDPADDDPVLAELRRGGVSTTRELADALGQTPVAVRAALRPLVAAGAVERTGHARGTRYHAW